MNTKILLSLLVIGIVALGIGMGTLAYFSDSESSTGNTFTAGTLDLKVGDKDDPNVYHFDVGPLNPADTDEHTFKLKNAGSITGYASMEIQNFADNGNGLGEPEENAGDLSDGVGEGELDEQTKIKAWVDDDCDNEYDVGEDVIFEEYANNLPADVDLLDDTNGYVTTDYPLAQNAELCIAVSYVFENKAGTENNKAQGDSFGFDILFDLNQVQATTTTTTTSTTTTSTTTSTTTTTVITGWKNPTANSAIGLGFNIPDNAYADGGTYAGGYAESWPYGSANKHQYYGYDFSFVPSGATIDGIEVRMDAWRNNLATTGSVAVELSWDGGTTWTTTGYGTGNLNLGETTYYKGGTSDIWGHTWTADEIKNSFRVRLTASASGGTNGRVYIDWVPVRVTYH